MYLFHSFYKIHPKHCTQAVNFINIYEDLFKVVRLNKKGRRTKLIFFYKYSIGNKKVK
jgi:hypothetical protein